MSASMLIVGILQVIWLAACWTSLLTLIATLLAHIIWVWDLLMQDGTLMGDFHVTPNPGLALYLWMIVSGAVFFACMSVGYPPCPPNCMWG